ncbi:hypothetical protein GCM10022233_70470 [Streptomyces shaanxiensis]|uniref:Uncharacterized protein n=1 Tax=Streptomyces shaanxiensis TaxID=653357 RepID=A0ABP7W577_9ACTN
MVASGPESMLPPRYEARHSIVSRGPEAAKTSGQERVMLSGYASHSAAGFGPGEERETRNHP